MTILPQVQDELVAAAGRPHLTSRVSARLVTVLVTAVLALLIAAPPSIAGLSASAGVVATRIAQ
jgi:hypothetical protein